MKCAQDISIALFLEAQTDPNQSQRCFSIRTVYPRRSPLTHRGDTETVFLSRVHGNCLSVELVNRK